MKKVGIWLENILSKGNNYSKDSKTETHPSDSRKGKEFSISGAEQRKEQEMRAKGGWNKIM